MKAKQRNVVRCEGEKMYSRALEKNPETQNTNAKDAY